MLFFFCTIFLYIDYGESKWSKGVVHYAVNQKDYDLHSQDIIASTFKQLQKEICVKFFNTPLNHSMADNEKILFISNPNKRKNCPPENYNFDKSVVDMPIGYKCLNDVDISRIVFDMLKASIGPTNSDQQTKEDGATRTSKMKPQKRAPASIPNRTDLLQTFQEQKKYSNNDTLLSAEERNFINANYLEECVDFVQKPINARRSYGGSMELTAANERFYKDKLWPLGIIMYGVDSRLMTSSSFAELQQAMTTIEQSSCVVFQYIPEDEPLQPKNLLWFGLEGEEIPHLGFMEGNQSVLMSSMLIGAPGHSAHTLNLLMRILGVPMMSNRYDRNIYVRIHWDKVVNMKEHYLERTPEDAWLKNTEGEGTAYDFDSVTHAPVNYMCADCSLGQQTVQPLQDDLWERTLSMGHWTDLSFADVEMLNLLYSRQCELRFISNRY